MKMLYEGYLRQGRKKYTISFLRSTRIYLQNLTLCFWQKAVNGTTARDNKE